MRAPRPALLLAASLMSAIASAAAPPPREPQAPYTRAMDTIEITAPEAPVTLAGTVLGTVKRGQWFGVRERKEDLLAIQFFGGRNLRQGWVRAADARVLADGDVDLAAQALELAREFDPAVDVKALRAEVDALAARVARAAAEGAAPRDKALRISLQLFGTEGFRYDVTPRTLDRVLRERRGNCLGLSLLYLCAAEKLGMAFHMLPFPGHALIRYDDGQEQFNVEPSMGGMVFRDEAYMLRRYGQPQGIGWTLLSKPQTMTMLLADVGGMLGDHKRTAEATRCFTRAIEVNPRYEGAYYNWGTALAAQGQHALACDKFARATQLRPGFLDAYNNWGTSLVQLGELRWACDKFATAARLDPTSPTPLYNWGMTLLRLGRRDEAIAKLAQAIELQPSLKKLVDDALAQ